MAAENRGKTGAKRPPPEGRRFRKGESGNPGGRPLAFKAFRDLCQAQLELVLKTWVEILKNKKADPHARNKAGENIAAYAVGKPPQGIQIQDADGAAMTMADLIRSALDDGNKG